MISEKVQRLRGDQAEFKTLDDIPAELLRVDASLYELRDGVNLPHRNVCGGKPFVTFLTLRNAEDPEKSYYSFWVFCIDNIAGTREHIQRYETKKGWRIVDFGNFALDKNKKGVFEDAVLEHADIYRYCKKSIGVNLETQSLREGFAGKLAEIESKAAEESQALKDRIAQLEAELSRKGNSARKSVEA